SDDNVTLRGRGLMDFLGVAIYMNDPAYTLQPRDAGGIIVCFAGCTITLPPNMKVGFSISVLQWGAGAVNFTVGAGGVVRNRQNHTALAGQFAAVSLLVVANPDGLSAQYAL